jgi:hypothetical protein
MSIEEKDKKEKSGLRLGPEPDQSEVDEQTFSTSDVRTLWQYLARNFPAVYLAARDAPSIAPSVRALMWREVPK